MTVLANVIVAVGLFIGQGNVAHCRPQFLPFQFPPFGFPQTPPSQAQPSQSPFFPFQFPQFGQPAPTGQQPFSPFSPFSFFQPAAPAPVTVSPAQAAAANLVSPKSNTGQPENLYPQLTQPAGRVPVSQADYLSRQNDAAKQAAMQKLAKYPDYPEPMVPASKTSVQYGGPPADMWGNFVDEDFDRQTGQLLVPSADQNPPPLISNPPSPDDVTQNF